MVDVKQTLLVSFLCISAISFCHAKNCKLVFKDCGSTAGSLSGALFNATCSSGKAILKHGTTVAITFVFKAKNNEAVLNSEVHGKIGVLPFVPFPLGNPNACKDSNVTCPVTANTPVFYTAALNILDSYPKVNVIVKWELQNNNKEDVFCALIPATITS